MGLVLLLSDGDICGGSSRVLYASMPLEIFDFFPREKPAATAQRY